MSTFTVPKQKQIRVIVDTDAKCEADDQYAIVHALLTPKFQIRGLIAAHYGNLYSDDTMSQSYQECQKILSFMNMTDQIKVFHGAKKAIEADNTFEYSEGADLIVREALSENQLPLFVIFQGAITDLACAYLAHPEIAGKLTAIWIGGGRYPEGGDEFNLKNDIHAANIIFQSSIELWQVPMNTYCKMQVSLTELEAKVAPYGDIGAYLFQQMLEVNEYHSNNPAWPRGESWSLGDSPAIGLMIDPMEVYSEMREAPLVDEDLHYSFTGSGRKIRVYQDINSRFILEDFFAKIEKFSKENK
ncbi:Inosine-uridine nucleoside N-ribohydrolase [Anaerocolumna jejuensis DSM 15929]|uniref:Inosine-uridine nucleoside N-ribohydrolase n=1 Tax=Anaerocolumna jejuensis DSM 15929 TaxID=1121322 RepID=A0A1M7BU46_9FIRM|nr:nucleoside hydrolase [Anaerocolumna jejuensis]SHL58464.1 Inosine-uridine nucleoside N-ribohydrolase [Anaerocolumna jejuensis DSM 15929]